MSNTPLDALRTKGYQIEYHNHAEAILTVDFQQALDEIETVMNGLTIPVESLVRSGGGETKTTQGLRHALDGHGWKKHNFTIQKLIDGDPRESISHEIDHVRILPKGKLALEIEWNNKDPFFDRDLENFKRLHAEAAISAGIIITRGESLQSNLCDLITLFAQNNNVNSYADLLPYGINPTTRQQGAVPRRQGTARTFAEAWAHVFCQDKYGQATTHWRKLQDRVHRGVGNPCPLLLIGIPDMAVSF